MKTENIKIGDTFSTVNKLLDLMGYKKTTNKVQIERNVVDCKRYLFFEKTGKISRGKITNEIKVTEIYSKPKEKIDKRINNGGARDAYNLNFSELFDTMAYILADSRTHSVTKTQSYTLKELYDLFGLCEERYILDNVYTDTKDKKEISKTILHNKFVADIRNKFKRLLEGSQKRLAKTGDVIIAKDFFVYGSNYHKRQLATIEEIALIAESETIAFESILDKEDNQSVLTQKAHKKFENNKDYQLSTTDLFLDFQMQLEYWELRNQIFKDITGKNYCSCFTFILNNQRDELIENMYFYVTRADTAELIKDSFRKWSVILIMTKTATFQNVFNEDITYSVYRKEHNNIKQKHDEIFGAENWNKYENFSTKEDFKNNLTVLKKRKRDLKKQ